MEDSDNDDMATAFMEEMEKLLSKYQEPTVGNALALNLEMQKQLREMQKRIQKALNEIDHRYKENEKILTDVGKKKTLKKTFNGAYQMGRSFYYSGSMYFRDEKMRNCPNNKDYLERKQNNEIFPADWELRSSHRWTHKDRFEIYKGVKNQVCTYLALLFNYPEKDVIEKLTNSHKDKLLEEELEELLQKAYKTSYSGADTTSQSNSSSNLSLSTNFQIDWVQISSYNISHRHSARSCEAYWNLYMKPSINRCAFKKDELERLMQIAEKYKYQNWDAIANELDSKRSCLQCYSQYIYSYKRFHPLILRKWNKKYDEKLMEIVNTNSYNGMINWNAVLTHFPNFRRETIKKRLAAMDPHHKSGLFTPEEDLLLIAAYNECNGNFRSIPRNLFPNRTLDQLRKHYKEVLANRAKIKPWNAEDDRKLLAYVSVKGESSWAACSREVFDGVHTAGSCRNRYVIIRNKFLNNPDINIEDIKRRNRALRTSKAISHANYLEKLRELNENYADVLPKTTKAAATVKPSTPEPKPNDSTKLEFREIAWCLKEATLTPTSSPLSKKRKRSCSPFSSPCSQKKSNEKTVPKKKYQPRKNARKKILYRSRLRVQELRIYNCVKYSYDFRFALTEKSKELTPNPGRWQLLYFIMKALGFDASTEYDFQFNHTYRRMSCQSRFKWRKVCSKVLEHIHSQENEQGDDAEHEEHDPDSRHKKITYGYELPPTWSSLLAFRSFGILLTEKYGSEQPQQQAMVDALNCNDSIVGIDDDPYVEIFQHRLQSLLLTTVILSRMKCRSEDPDANENFWYNKLITNSTQRQEDDQETNDSQDEETRSQDSDESEEEESNQVEIKQEDEDEKSFDYGT